MALTSCKECGGKVSDKAAACPHCGAPVASLTSNNKLRDVLSKCKASESKSASKGRDTKECSHCHKQIPTTAKNCPYCFKSQKRSKQSASKVMVNIGQTIWGIVVLVILGFLVNFLFFSGESKTEKFVREQKQQAQMEEYKQEEEERIRVLRANAVELEEYVAGLITEGLITRVEVESHEVYVEPAMWHPQPVMSKEIFTTAMATFCGGKSVFNTIETVDILDNYSGKKLAKMGIFGFKTY